MQSVDIVQVVTKVMIKGYFISLSCSNETNRKMSYGTWGNESMLGVCTIVNVANHACSHSFMSWETKSHL